MNPTESHFNDLMDKARSGDRKAMVLLLYRYERWLHRCRRRQLRERHEHQLEQDLTSDVHSGSSCQI